MNHIPVFYAEQMSAKYYDDLSPSAYKSEALINYWVQNTRYPIELISPKPVVTEELCLAHEPSYVTKVLSLEIDNGFHNRLPEIAAALPYTSGSMLSAAYHVINNGSVACSPTSGFHHAHYDFGGGFCTFNGLMVTALALKQEGKVNRVGILDCDNHYADGTINIIKHLGIDWITHYCKNSGYQPTAKKFLDNLKALMASFYDCDIILYQAGADAHVDDPLGGFLNTLEMSQRDHVVFEQAKSMGIPLVWNLAGGYQASIDPEGKKNIHKSVELHTNTLKECIKVYFAD